MRISLKRERVLGREDGYLFASQSIQTLTAVYPIMTRVGGTAETSQNGLWLVESMRRSRFRTRMNAIAGDIHML